MKYKFTELSEEISIKKIVSIHYFEYMSDFVFAGESHNFWEFLCVDKGEVEVTADHEKFTMHRGDIIFHKPNEFHSVAANGVSAPNLVVITFECQDPCMRFFENQILSVGENERNLLAQIISEAGGCFTSVLDDPYLEQLVKKEVPVFGSEQMIKIHLEELLIQLFRHFAPYSSPYNAETNLAKSRELFQSVLSYFDLNIRSQLTIEQISKDNLIGSSQLKKLFHDQNRSGVIELFNQMKIDHAKQLIRNRQMNFTQIADYLGYTSVHYFSRQFKKITGMTPSEYTASIKKLAEKRIFDWY